MGKINWKVFIPKIFIYILGLFVMAFGISFSVRSNLGISPVSSLPFALGRITGLSMGTFVTAMFVVYVLIQIVLLRRNFKWINLTQVLFAIMFGYFVDFSNRVTANLAPISYLGQFALLLLSAYTISFSLTLYMEANLIPLPTEGVVATITQLLPNGKFGRVKIAFDCILVAIAIILSWVFLRNLEGIREGTIISGLLIGKMVPFNEKLSVGLLRRFGYSKQASIIQQNFHPDHYTPLGDL